RESARIASTLGYEVLSNAWSNETKNLQTAIVKYLWDEQSGRFLKSVKPHDSSIDTAILGLTYPFRVLERDDPRILISSRQIESRYPRRHSPGLTPCSFWRYWNTEELRAAFPQTRFCVHLVRKKRNSGISK